MPLINVVAVIVVTSIISIRTRRIFIEIIPLVMASLLIVLYILAFLNRLRYIDYVSCAILSVILFWIFARLYIASKKKNISMRRILLEIVGGNYIQLLKSYVFVPSTLILLLTLVSILFLAEHRIVTWWDDLNYWATDAKALYYLDGYASKYGNVAPEFGDYPPITQLAKWFYLHILGRGYDEGILFVGYYSMIIVFLAPLLGFVDSISCKIGCWDSRINRLIEVIIRLVLIPILGLVLWLMPSMVESFYYEGMCADLVVAVVLGAYYCSVIDQRGQDSCIFYYARLAIYLSIMVLTKNVAFIWVAIGIVYTWLYHIFVIKKIDIRGLIVTTVVPIVVAGSWFGYCYINRRVANLTGAFIGVMRGEQEIAFGANDIIKSFVTAFIRWPLHRQDTAIVNLTPLTCYILILTLIVIFMSCKILNKSEGILLFAYLGIIGVVFYGLNLLMHLTIFVMEYQYLDPYAMIGSIERYGVPYTMGSLYLLAYIAIYRFNNIGWIGYLLMVLLTCDYKGGYEALIGYRDKLEDNIEARISMVDDESMKLLNIMVVDKYDREVLGLLDDVDGENNMCIQGGKYGDIRVLYIHDDNDASWVRNTYLNYLVSPYSLVHVTVDYEELNSEYIIKLVDVAHADYVYIDDKVGDIDCGKVIKVE